MCSSRPHRAEKGVRLGIAPATQPREGRRRPARRRHSPVRQWERRTGHLAAAHRTSRQRRRSCRARSSRHVEDHHVDAAGLDGQLLDLAEPELDVLVPTFDAFARALTIISGSCRRRSPDPRPHLSARHEASFPAPEPRSSTVSPALSAHGAWAHRNRLSLPPRDGPRRRHGVTDHVRPSGAISGPHPKDAERSNRASRTIAP